MMEPQEPHSPARGAKDAGTRGAERREPERDAGGGGGALAVAARSIATRMGVAETIVDVLRGRALRHFSEGLRQYLTIRTGDAVIAAHLMRDLRRWVSSPAAEGLVDEPGPRARLYHKAREIACARNKEQSGQRPRASLPWRSPGPEAASTYLEALAQVRAELPDADAELLELRYARELPLADIAYVVEEPLEQLEPKLAAAEEAAQRMLGPSPPSRVPGLGGALIEAFAIEAPPRDPNAPETQELNDSDAGAREPLAPDAVVANRYKIERRVGVGAFGDVYRASDMDVAGHVVALKLLHQPAPSPRSRAEALRELKLIASVFHPSVVQFKDHGWHDDRLWFVMPWYEGEPLESRIMRAPLGRAEARRIFESLARALATMHASEVRHQDIKPENIFLAKIRGFGTDDAAHDVLPVLLDLGVAAKEAEMVVAGTPMYFAPEVAAQFASIAVRHAITTKADIFSLALSLRNALEPSTQEDVPSAAVESFIEHRSTHVPAMPISKDLRYLGPHFSRWLSLEPDERPTADVFADELRVLTEPEERRARAARFLRWAIPIGAALVVAFASVVYVFSKRTELQQLEIERARIEAADARTDRDVAEAKRASLEHDLRTSYESSRMSRSQLAGRLARTETRVSTLERQRTALRDQLGRERALGHTLRRELGTARSEAGAAETRASQASADAERQRARVAQLTLDVDAARAEAQQLARDLAQARADIAERSTELDTARAQLASDRARLEELERRATAAERRSAQLERELAEAHRGGGGAGGSSGSGSGGPPEPSALTPAP